MANDKQPDARPEATPIGTIPCTKLGPDNPPRRVRDRAPTPSEARDPNLPSTFDPSKKFIQNLQFDGLMWLLSFAKNAGAGSVQRAVEEEMVVRLNSPVSKHDLALFSDGKKFPTRRME